MLADLRAEALALCEALDAYSHRPTADPQLWHTALDNLLVACRALRARLAEPEVSAAAPSEDAPGAACSKCGEAFPSLRHREECVAVPTPTAPDFAALVAARLAPLRQSHAYCEDSWYSCPLQEDGCADDSQHGCTCGADAHNAALDKAAQDIGRGIAAALAATAGRTDRWGEDSDADAARAFEEAV